MTNRPSGERVADLEKLRVFLLLRPRTVDEMCSLLGVGRRTVYRYLDELESPPLVRVGVSRPTRYSMKK